MSAARPLPDDNEPAAGALPGGPTDEELAKLVGDLGRPVAQLLTALSSAAVQLLRTMLDAAYARGYTDAMREAGGKLPPALRVVRNDSDRSEPVATAEQLERLRQRRERGEV